MSSPLAPDQLISVGPNACTGKSAVQYASLFCVSWVKVCFIEFLGLQFLQFSQSHVFLLLAYCIFQSFLLQLWQSFFILFSLLSSAFFTCLLHYFLTAPFFLASVTSYDCLKVSGISQLSPCSSSFGSFYYLLFLLLFFSLFLLSTRHSDCPNVYNFCGLIWLHGGLKYILVQFLFFSLWQFLSSFVSTPFSTLSLLSTRHSDYPNVCNFCGLIWLHEGLKICSSLVFSSGCGSFFILCFLLPRLSLFLLST